MLLLLSSIKKCSFIGAYAAIGGGRGVVCPSASQSFARVLGYPLGLEVRRSTIATISAVGFMTSLNSRAAIVPRTTEEGEVLLLRDLGLDVFQVPSNLLAWGNLMSANDKGAIFSHMVPRDMAAQIAERLGVDYDFITPKGCRVSGSSIATSNKWAIVSKSFTDDEITRISDLLKVKVASGTVNGGYRQIKVGALVSDVGILLGRDTTGPEILEVQAALG